jgi:hypothetical protein
MTHTKWGFPCESVYDRIKDELTRTMPIAGTRTVKKSRITSYYFNR